MKRERIKGETKQDLLVQNKEYNLRENEKSKKKRRWLTKNENKKKIV
jgi:hypothetical protein